jgi:membrane-associated phospholipid phosphatase
MKKLITQQKRWVLMLATLVIFYTPYLLVNHLSSGHNELPFILGEEKIPFLPWTVIIYLSAFLQGIILYWKVEKSTFFGIFKILGIFILAHIFVFLIYPTEFPRNGYESGNLFLVLFRLIDEPVNCFPSLHVSVSLLFAICWQYRVKNKPKVSVFLFWFWSLIVIISTMTTKQHYLLDILGSLFLDGGIIYLLRKYIKPCE